QSRGDVDPALLILLDAVRTAARAPIEQEHATRQLNGAVWAQVEAVELAGAPDGIVIVISDEQKAIIGRHQHTVGPFQLAAQDAGDFAIGINAIHPFDRSALLVADPQALATARAR